MSVHRHNVVVVGALGRMGERLRAALRDDPGLRLGAALERPGHPQLGSTLESGVVVTDDVKAALREAELAVVFATPEPTVTLVEAAAEAGVACVVGSTGFSPEERTRLESASARIPMVLAPNFSVAVNVLIHLTRKASKLLGEDYQAEILELHHAAKRDAPSGTALRLGDAVAEARGSSLGERGVFSRHGDTGPRPPQAIGMQTLRGGDNPGEHTVMFLGAGERLELIHRAATRDHFAVGALRAARWLLDGPGDASRPAGLYDMERVLGLTDA